MNDERQRAANELKDWRMRHKNSLAANEAGCALNLEQALRSDAIPVGALGSRPEGYPLDADNAD